MKKQLTYTIIGVLLLTFVIASSTYAFFSSAFSGNNNLNAVSSNMDIVYSGSGSFSDTMTIVANKEEGYRKTISMHTTNDSVHPKINLYINIENITDNLKIEGFVWEICAERGTETPICNNGNFSGYNSTTNNSVPILTNYSLTTENTNFKIYIWLDGSKINTSLTGASFSGYINAISENFKARFD